MQRWTWFHSTGHIKRVGMFSCVKKRRTPKHKKAKCLFLAALVRCRIHKIWSCGCCADSVIPSQGCSILHRKPRNVEPFAWAEAKGKGPQRSSFSIPQRVKLLLRVELIPPTRYLSACCYRVWLDSFPQIRLVCIVRFFFAFTPGISSWVSERSSLTLCC